MASTPKYKPPIDVAFKQRLYAKVGKIIADAIVAEAELKIADSYLVEGDQRAIVPDAILDAFEIDTKKTTVIGVLNKGRYVEKTAIPSYIQYLGDYKGMAVWGFSLSYSSFGYDPQAPIKPDAVYDAPTDNDWGRSVGERGLVEEKIEAIAEKVPVETPAEELPDTSKKKVKK